MCYWHKDKQINGIETTNQPTYIEVIFDKRAEVKSNYILVIKYTSKHKDAQSLQEKG